MTTCRIAYAVSLVVCVAGASADMERIAVHDLIPQGIEQSAASLISDRLRSELFKTGAFTVMERGQMEEILKEQGFQQSGCVSDACAIQVGEMLGVSHIVVGSIGKVGKTFTVNVRYLDVRTGQVVHTVSTDCRCEVDIVLSRSTVEIAEELARTVGNSGETVAHGGKQGALGKAAEAADDDAGDERKRKRVKVVVRIASGAVAAAGLAAGLIFDQQTAGHIEEAEDIKAATTAANYETSASAYADAYTNAETSMLLRNISYGVAGLGAVGFGITFFF